MRSFPRFSAGCGDPLKSWAISLRPWAKSGAWMSSSEPAPLLLDTHYWIWMQLGEASHFTERMLTAIRQAAASGSLLVSAISVWELGMLEAKGRIRLKPSCEEWVKEALAAPGQALASITPEIALESSRLPGP